MENKKTLVIGASIKPERYSYKAVKSLLEHGHEVVAIGAKEAELDSVKIHKTPIAFENVDTVTMYISEKFQPEYYDYIIKKIAPKRVIFNPGTENDEFAQMLEKSGIKVEIACTLVLLSIGEY
ncbi:MAG: CoA-binding protein [Bacteroidales bacterium]|nr:CoA-binding protein [Bacteroidales bacterium]